ncbi:TetR/AcrR family transcriptional regulator [Shewanella sp. KJ2020]|uniref:TetR/AcrR family transcriptional regulator n=1 Tax=Shewanella sp. KJ2020 TaxID=2919172 RepID=UPI0020A773D1|nr:TetR/AcrR family transcriptional regulator [Shewanella sp. KJ2020]MCP3130078.1 TetR/AcrR family transcriptional regulator [Shewanella sp. KJ2020]
MSTATQMPCVGRPRAFDTNYALAKALEVFWRKGFEGTSLTDLTQAMGINKPSLYAAFGNKEQLFLKAIELYEQRPCAFFYPALEQKTAYQVVESMLLGAASSLADASHPQGCLIVQGALTCSEAGEAIKETLINRRRDGEQALCERLQRAKDEGDLPETADPLLLARYIGTVLQGMAVQATNGICSQELRQVAELVLANFPKSNR